MEYTEGLIDGHMRLKGANDVKINGTINANGFGIIIDSNGID